MLKNKKQLLGLMGLVAVGIMTAIAYTMPTPDAAAIEESAPGYECDESEGRECASSGGDVNVQVVVQSAVPDIKTGSPKNGSTTVDPVVRVSTQYSQVRSIQYQLYYMGQNGTENTLIDETTKPIDNDGGLLTGISFDLASYGRGYGQYKLVTKATPLNSDAPIEDTTVFNYEAITADTTNPSEGGNPGVDLTVGKDVDKVTIHIYDEKGQVVKDKDGNDLILEVDPSEIDPDTGKVNVQIPFEENGLPGGEYTAVIIAQDKDGEVLSMVTLKITYKPVTPDTPNTGLAVLNDLNISKLDYLLTGLLAFGLVAAFAMYLIFRKNHR